MRISWQIRISWHITNLRPQSLEPERTSSNVASSTSESVRVPDNPRHYFQRMVVVVVVVGGGWRGGLSSGIKIPKLSAISVMPDNLRFY